MNLVRVITIFKTNPSACAMLSSNSYKKRYLTLAPPNFKPDLHQSRGLSMGGGGGGGVMITNYNKNICNCNVIGKLSDLLLSFPLPHHKGGTISWFVNFLSNLAFILFPSWTHLCSLQLILLQTTFINN